MCAKQCGKWQFLRPRISTSIHHVAKLDLQTSSCSILYQNGLGIDQHGDLLSVSDTCTLLSLHLAILPRKTARATGLWRFSHGRRTSCHSENPHEPRGSTGGGSSVKRRLWAVSKSRQPVGHFTWVSKQNNVNPLLTSSIQSIQIGFFALGIWDGILGVGQPEK